jgi:hypothetical protein
VLRTPLSGAWHHGLPVPSVYPFLARADVGHPAVLPWAFGRSIRRSGLRPRLRPAAALPPSAFPSAHGRFAQHRCPTVRARRIGLRGRSLIKRFANVDWRPEHRQSTSPLRPSGRLRLAHCPARLLSPFLPPRPPLR